MNAIDLNAAIRLAAANVFDADRALHSDLLDLLACGEENAMDTLGETVSEGVVENANEAFFAVAHSTIGGLITDRYFDPRYGSEPQRVRDWFAQFISF